MKCRPILFSGPMVRALLAGRKTQTRRVVKWPSWVEDVDWAAFALNSIAKRGGSPTLGLMADGRPKLGFRCPCGAPGDRLWVKETFGATDLTLDDKHLPGIHYRATDDWPKRGPWPWRPSIFMPRWASRITLEITDVRVERLQDISEADAIAEGVEYLPDVGGWRCYLEELAGYASPVTSYRSLWESINGPGSWAANPWVWVVGFRREVPR